MELFDELNIHSEGDGLTELFNLFGDELPFGYALTIGAIFCLETEHGTKGVGYLENSRGVVIYNQGKTRSRFFHEWERSPKEYINSLRERDLIDF